MNQKFSIAIGRSRKDTRWKNEEWSWDDLLARLRETHRTHETYAEYCAAKPGRQAEIKDVGGFVGGRLAGGRRLAGAVTCRQLVTLDIDHSIKSVWDDFTFLYGNCACMYTTHKHSPETPRYRLVIPLDREVTADEYVPIARRIAGMIGIELFDVTTYQPSRLMYWPSTAVDGVYEFEQQDGDWMSADEILSSYRDWRDVSEWPLSLREQEVNVSNMKRQGDPLEKPGIVGAFCRTYSIAEVIDKYLSDVYEKTDDGRYTFSGGSTSAGLVVYDDKFAYSHHGTDPCSSKLVNSYDIVRLHKFGLMDEDCREGTPIHRRPSFIAMRDLAMKDGDVRHMLGKEKLAEAFADFAEFEGEENGEVQPYNDDWLREMNVDKGGNYVNTINNVSLILENDPHLKGCFAFDAFKDRKVLLKDLPWRSKSDYPYVKDVDEAHLRKYMEKYYGISGGQVIRDGFDAHIDSKSFHPVRDYLNKIKWDGEPRLDTLFIDCLGAEDTEYTRTATRKAFVAAAARVRVPGIKFDVMPVLISSIQGLGKSTLLRMMGGEWFSDSFGDVKSNSAAEQLQGVWIMEVGELAKMKNADVDAVKLFLSKIDDSYRPAYGRYVVTRKRQGIIFGTANEANFLKDKTGNRRFWPIMCDVAPIRMDVRKGELEKWYIDQVWAEADELFKIGEKLYMEGEMEETARKVQANHEEIDEKEGMIIEFLNTEIPVDWDQREPHDRRMYLMGVKDSLNDSVETVMRDKVTAAEIWVELFGGSIRDMNGYNTKPIHTILKRIKGWQCVDRTRVKFYGRQISYVKIGVSQH